MNASDTGKFRTALLMAGFFRYSEGTIFNDVNKAKTWRRLKLWFADEVFNSSQKQQQVLEKELRQQFGDRILTMYFLEGRRWSPGKALCIRLTA